MTMRNNGHAKVSSVLSQRFDVVNSDFIYRLFSKQKMIIIQQGRVGGVLTNTNTKTEHWSSSLIITQQGRVGVGFNHSPGSCGAQPR